jgi:hypothetical protein
VPVAQMILMLNRLAERILPHHFLEIYVRVCNHCLQQPRKGQCSRSIMWRKAISAGPPHRVFRASRLTDRLRSSRYGEKMKFTVN